MLCTDCKACYAVCKVCGFTNENVVTVDFILLCLANLGIFKLYCTFTLACCAGEVRSLERKLIINEVFSRNLMSEG